MLCFVHHHCSGNAEVVVNVVVAVVVFWEYLFRQVCEEGAEVEEVGQRGVAWFVFQKDIDEAQAGLGEHGMQELKTDHGFVGGVESAYIFIEEFCSF